MKLVSLDLHVLVLADPNALHVRYTLDDGVERGPIVLSESEAIEAFALWERGLALLRAAERREANEGPGASAFPTTEDAPPEHVPLHTDPRALRPRRGNDT